MGVIPDDNNLSAPQRLHTDLLYSGIAASAVTTTSANIGYPGWQSSVIHRNWLDLLLVVFR